MPTLNWIGKEKVMSHHQDVPFRVFQHKYNFSSLKGQKSTENGLNKIIYGDNLEALKSLLPEFEGKIKCIYIDPPYNTGNDDFGYNDRFNHSAWLTFIKNRLSIAQKLLSKEGAIWINIDDDEGHYLKVLADDIFGRDNFVANIVWEKKYSPQNDAKWFSDMHDHILVYAKDKNTWRPNLLPRTKEMDSRYTNRDNDPRGPWKAQDFSVKTYTEKNDYPITTPSGRTVEPPDSRCWSVNENRFKELVEDNRIWFGEDGSAVPALKKFLSDVQQGIPPSTIWQYSEVGHTQDARKEVIELFKDEEGDFSTPKPEFLLKRIIHIGSNAGDIVLEFFAGSGTTGAVAHKMERQYILCEQMDYVESVTLKRLQKVIEGEQGGISEEVDWQGGGSFTFLELMQFNEQFITQIEDADSKEDLQQVWNNMKQHAFLIGNPYQEKECFLEPQEDIETSLPVQYGILKKIGGVFNPKMSLSVLKPFQAFLRIPRSLVGLFLEYLGA